MEQKHIPPKHKSLFKMNKYIKAELSRAEQSKSKSRARAEQEQSKSRAEQSRAEHGPMGGPGAET